MQEAIYLASSTRFSATPNPSVGCVITRDGQIIGRGAHAQAGQAHAEVLALADAGDAKGATAYVTLEPCNHQGRTGPCSEALINAGIRRVVYAIADPNPAVDGGGAARLIEAGIKVSKGVLAAQARFIHRGFLSRIQSAKPWVRLKMGSSLDGRSALASGQSQWITSHASRADVQLMRAESCAVLSGVGTILSDNPSLNTRLSAASVNAQKLRQPLRVITDAQGRLDGSQKLFSLDGAIRVYTALAVYPFEQDSMHAVVNTPNVDGRLDLAWVLEDLALNGVNMLMLEAGAKLAGAFLAAGLVDEIVVYIAPKLLGHQAYPSFRLPLIEQMDSVKSWHLRDVQRFGDDVKLSYLQED